MKKFIWLVIVVILCTACGESNIAAPLKSANIQDTEYNAIVLNYINYIKEHVSTGEIKLYGDYLHLIPVGSPSSANCSLTLESTPYGGNFIYAYVGVVKTANTYTYYFVSKDTEGYGYNFNSLKQIQKEHGAYCYSGDILYTYDLLGNYYNSNGSDYVEVDIGEIDVNSSIINVLNTRNVTKARIYYPDICN